MGSIASAEQETINREQSRRGFSLNRFLHRVGGLFAALLILWIAGTGTMMQVLDLKAIFTHEPPTDPQELSMAEGMYGPGNYAVIQVSDFSAPALPKGFDINHAIGIVLQSVQTQQKQPARPGADAGAEKGPSRSGGQASRMGANQKGDRAVRPGRRTGGSDGGLGAAAGAAPAAGVNGDSGGVRRGGDGSDQLGPMAWVELRVANGIPIGQVMLGTKLEAFNALTGDAVTPVPPVALPQGRALPPSLRQKLKTLHRFWNRSDTPGVYFEFLSGLILFTLLLTGLVMYFRLLGTRARQGRKQLFWLKGGGWWRGLHRVISVAAALFILCMAFTGTWIGFESSANALRRSGAGGTPRPEVAGQQRQLRAGGGPPGQGASGSARRRNPIDFIIPLRDAEVQEMTATTVTSMQQLHPDLPIKAIRMRIYGQMKQGVLITGGEKTNQYVFNADTGAPASLSEPSYPDSGFPFGVQVHEDVKHFHSGDMFGVPTRLMNLFAGFSLTFLSISGLVMYFDMWLRRRKGGHNNLMWR